MARGCGTVRVRGGWWMPEFEDWDAYEAWLQEQPREVVVAMAARRRCGHYLRYSHLFSLQKWASHFAAFARSWPHQSRK